MKYLIGIDLSFRATGIIILEIKSNNIVYIDTIRTKKENKKRKIRTADDDMVQSMVMARSIIDILKKYPGVIIVELPHGGARGHRAHRCMGIATGVMGAIAEILKYPIEFYSQSECKKAVTGNKNASKIEVENIIRKKFHADWPQKKVISEHIFDAGSALVAGIEYSQLYRLLAVDK